MTAAIRIHAYAECTYLGDHKYDVDYSTATHARLTSTYLDTREEAEAFAALFPKSCKLHVTSVSNVGGISSNVKWVISSHVKLVSDGVTGERNETGIKRYRMLVAKADKLGIDVLFESNGTVNAHPTRESFESAIA